MANYPNINSIKLDTCCIKAIAEINKVLKSAKILTIGVGTGQFANIFGPSPATINTIVAVQQTDFSLFAQAVSAIPHLTKRLVHDISSYECLNHKMGNNVKLEKFWKGIMDASQ